MASPNMREEPLPPRPKPTTLLTPLAYGRTGAPDPALDWPAYKSSVLRHPKQALVYLPQTLTEITGPRLGDPAVIGALDADLTQEHEGDPIGERITVRGRVMDTEGKPLRNTLVEIWQANAAGRYRHRVDRWPAPLDPNFSGAGRCVTDARGRYKFTTVKPGAYPWKNHPNAWRPNHIHFSLFGPSFLTRLVTQMYFPGDPLIALDPIANSVTDPKALQRLIAVFDLETTVPEWALGYRFDIVLDGPGATSFEDEENR